MPTRREILGTALAGAAAAGLAARSAQAQEFGPVETDADIDALLPQISNWGRWGPEDQLGTLNLLTPAMTRDAARLIRSGRVVPLAREMPVSNPEGARSLAFQTYRMVSYTDPPPDESGCIDFIGMIYHGFAITHIDALCHFYTPEGLDGMFNGFPISAVTESGAEKLGVEVMGGRGIVGRGVLLDIAALKGGPLPTGSAIYPADLDAAETAQGVAVGTGDILLVRNGAGRANVYASGTGLQAACLPWLHARGVAALGGDSDNDQHPAGPGFRRYGSPIHAVALPFLGLPLIDQLDLDDLARICAEEGRWEFFLTIAPWRFKGATSSPVNPLAIF